jgi:hypothetical protein
MLGRLGTGLLALALWAAGFAGIASAEPPNLRKGINFEAWQRWTNKVDFLAGWYDRTNFPDWSKAVNARQLASVREQGFDFVRVNVDPSPFLWDDSQRERLADGVLRAVRRLQAGGLTVVVDLHIMEETAERPQGRHYVLGTGGVQQTDGFARYLDLVTDLAGRLATLPQSQTVLELMNEPDQDWFSWTTATDRWPTQLSALYQAARRAAPDLSLVLTGARGGGTEGLLRLDPTDYVHDPKVFWSFHVYTPLIVTHSGLPWEVSPRRFLLGVPWPATDIDPALRGRLIAEARQRMRDTVKDPAQQATLARDIAKTLDEYIASKEDDASLRQNFGQVADWAKRYGIPADRIVLGEFGVYRDHVAPEVLAAVLRDTRSAAEQRGFAWAVYTAGVTQPGKSFAVTAGKRILDVDPVIRNALGLER